MAETKNATVLFDVIHWKDADGNRQSAEKGKACSLPAAEFARLEALGAIEKAGASKAKSGTAASVDEGEEITEADKPEGERAAHADATQPPSEAPGGSQNPEGDGPPPEDDKPKSSKKG